MRTINKMTKPLNASVFSEEFFESYMSERKCVHVKIMKKKKKKIPKEVRGLLLGGFGNGKTTLVATLTTGKRDDGNGRARMRIMRHKVFR